MKEAPRFWALYFMSLIVGMGWIQSEWEPCLYFYKESGKIVGILTVFVDDLLFVGLDRIWTALMTNLNKIVPIKDLGRPDDYLGVQLIHTKTGI